MGLVLVCGLKGLPQLEGPPNIDISIVYRIFRLYIEYEYTWLIGRGRMEKRGRFG